MTENSSHEQDNGLSDALASSAVQEREEREADVAHQMQTTERIVEGLSRTGH